MLEISEKLNSNIYYINTQIKSCKMVDRTLYKPDKSVGMYTTDTKADIEQATLSITT